MFIIISVLLVTCSIILDLLPNFVYSSAFKLAIYVLAMLLVFIDMKIKLKKINNIEEKTNIRRKHLIIILIIYVILLGSLLFIDKGYRREKWQYRVAFLSQEHFKLHSNFIPFKTIGNYIKGALKDTVGIKTVLINIIGNIIAFAPFGIFIPLIWNKYYLKFKNFILLMCVIIGIVEIMQFVTMIGACDIDDLILNLFGACTLYGLLRISKIRKIVDKVVE